MLRGTFLLLRGLGWVLLAIAAVGWLLFGYWRLRLREYRLPDVSTLERAVLWDKDDLYSPAGRRVLALCGWSLEVALASTVLAAGLLALVPAPARD